MLCEVSNVWFSPGGQTFLTHSWGDKHYSQDMTNKFHRGGMDVSKANILVRKERDLSEIASIVKGLYGPEILVIE